jgi:hypothetical protein
MHVVNVSCQRHGPLKGNRQHRCASSWRAMRGSLLRSLSTMHITAATPTSKPRPAQSPRLKLQYCSSSTPCCADEQTLRPLAGAPHGHHQSKAMPCYVHVRPHAGAPHWHHHLAAPPRLLGLRGPRARGLAREHRDDRRARLARRHLCKPLALVAAPKLRNGLAALAAGLGRAGARALAR